MTIELCALRVENLVSPLAVWTPRPRFTWNIQTTDADVRQLARQVRLLDEHGDVLYDTGRVDDGDCVLVAALAGDLQPATRYRVGVRAWVASEAADGSKPTPWLTAEFETALFEQTTDAPHTWQGQWVEPEQQPVTIDGAHNIMESFAPVDTAPYPERLHPVKRLRQRIQLDPRPTRARLRVTARGVYTAEINGQRVGNEVLAPGYESYHLYHSVQTYDVTSLLQPGDNVLALQLADGWWAGRISILGLSAQYGDKLAATWQLEVTHPDGHLQVIGSDDSVVSDADGPIRWSDIFIGEGHDARLADPAWSTASFDDTQWTPVRTHPVTERLVPFVGEPIRRIAELPPRAIMTTPAGETVVDFGQVIAGRVRMRVRGEAGTTLRLEHSEVLDEHGNFLNNISGRNKDQTDVYTVRGDSDGEVWEPEFTFHGFRYCRVTGLAGTPRAADFTAVVIGNDLRETSTFTTDDPRINQLHSNVVWSQRANFLGVPTDCPQRERAGWTGDIQVFAPTASTNADVLGFLTRWLDNLRADQDADGSVPIIVPLPPAFAATFEQAKRGTVQGLDAISSAAGWSDAVVIVPHVLWRRFGDTKVLRDNYPAMQAWVERQRVECTQLPARLADADLPPDQAGRQALLWNGLFNFGDWLTPSLSDATDPHSIMQAPLRTAELVGPMFQAHSLDLIAEIAGVLGHSEDAEAYRSRAASVREAFAAEYVTAEGRLPQDLQGIHVLALAFDMVPQQHRDAVVRRLTTLVHDNGERLDTGFLSVPFLLDVLYDAGHADLARTLLWQSQCPSWLYEVDRGATTIWEAWDAVKPDGHVGTMSFNHYAFGCVDDVLFRRIAGLWETSPGYATSKIAPDLDCPLGQVSASIDTPRGRLAVTWQRSDAVSVGLAVDVPPNTTARVVLPQSWTGPAGALDAALGSGHHELTVRKV